MRLFAAIFLICLGALGTSARVVDPKVMLGENPGEASFCWKMDDRRPGITQEAYLVRVMDADGKEIWNSGRVASPLSVHIPYEGPALKGGEKYSWNVTVWNNKDKAASTSPTTGWINPLDEGQWSGAEWIGLPGDGKTISDEESQYDLPARYLRRELILGSGVKSATLYVSGLGNSYCYINGKRVGDDVFGPLPTLYDVSVPYLMYDVTGLLKAGDNAIGAALGNGRYFGTRNGDDYGMNTLRFGYPCLLAKLLVRYEDGREETIVSDTGWMATDNGPVTRNNEYDGEHYDASLELGDWTKAGYSCSGTWRPAVLMPAPKGKMRAQFAPSMVVQDEIVPKEVRRTADGRIIVDLGQNVAGWLRVHLKGRKGERVTVKYSEILRSDDPEQLYVANLRLARCMDTYTPASDGWFEWEPQFVIHGFRYAEISGADLSTMPSTRDFAGVVAYDEMKPTGTFSCSDEILNMMHGNTAWGLRGNYRGMPTDCPQRDERMGWLGDRATGCYGEAFIFDVENLYRKWSLDIQESMREDGCISDVSPRYWTLWNEDVTWPAALFGAVDMLWRQFGNEQVVRYRYDAMKKWVGFILGRKVVDGIVTGDIYGDWCLPPESLELIHSNDPTRKTDGDLLGTSVMYDILGKMQDFAVVAGHPEDVKEYSEAALALKEAYNRRFFDRENSCYANNTVTANIMSLCLGLVPEGYEQGVMDNIVDKTVNEWNSHISVGLMGVQHLFRGLSEYGNVDLACTIASNDTYPSYGYMFRRGATTIWELWNGDTADPAMNSLNHLMLTGDCIIWMYEYLAGIRNGGGAFRRIELKPCPPKQLSNVDASYDSPYGRIVSSWKVEDGEFLWHVEIPANTTAAATIPGRFTPDGRERTMELVSGSYDFRSSSD
ncbi:MAG: family 78 glycoside hydrolase catalytic domain [Candidatus Cryptobacteroides sp.]